jgi:hypothetical protein
MSARASLCRREVFLVSLASLLLEISYTRIFSFKASSYFTYLLIGLALLGIGSGGVVVSIASSWRRRSGEQILPPLAFGTALAIVLGYLIVARIELSTFSPPTSLEQITSLAVVCLVVFTAFAGVGLMVAWIFSSQTAAIAQLYFADLVGAALGCVLAIPLMIWLTPPGCVLASAAVLAASGLRLARATRWRGSWRLRACSWSSGRAFPTCSPARRSIRRRPSRPATWPASITVSSTPCGIPSFASTSSRIRTIPSSRDSPTTASGAAGSGSSTATRAASPRASPLRIDAWPSAWRRHIPASS